MTRDMSHGHAKSVKTLSYGGRFGVWGDGCNKKHLKIQATTASYKDTMHSRC